MAAEAIIKMIPANLSQVTLYHRYIKAQIKKSDSGSWQIFIMS